MSNFHSHGNKINNNNIFFLLQLFSATMTLISETDQFFSTFRGGDKTYVRNIQKIHKTEFSGLPSQRSRESVEIEMPEGNTEDQRKQIW